MHRSGIALVGAAVALGVAAAGSPSPARAQEGEIERCRTAQTDAERIACLEDALRGDAPEAATPPPAPIGASDDAPDDDAEPAREGFRLPRVPFIGGRDEAPSPAASPPAVVASDSPEADAFGAEQLARATGGGLPAPPRLTAAVVGSREVPYRRLQVELDNGQVWRQVESDEPWNSRRYGDPVDVEIFESGFGGYRMRIVEQDKTLRVERVR